MKKIILIATVLLAAQVAQADFYTPIDGSSEPDFTDILNTIYSSSGIFEPDGLNYKNTTLDIYVQRMVDSTDSNPLNDGVNMNIVSGPAFGATDQIWDDGATEIYAKARFASYEQDFGYWTKNTSGEYSVWNPLFSVDPGYVQTGNDASPVLTGLDWAWGRQGTTENSSYAADNEDLLDHMLTYKVTGLADQGSWTVWLLRWDDQIGCVNDRDFNDSVIEIRATPVPAAVLLGILGLGVAGLKLRKFA